MKRLLAVLASVLLAGGCAGGSTPSPQPTGQPTSAPTLAPTITPSPTPSAVAAVAELIRSDLHRAVADPALASIAADAINAFGIDLYQRVATGPVNLVYSPASVAIALSMARAGAVGRTATEMDAVLHNLGSEDLATAANALDAALAARTGTFKDAGGVDQDVALRIANALFPQRGMALEPTFLDAMATRYDAGAWLVDYAGNPEGARLAINGWVADKTENRIPNILAPGDVTTAWRLALANAIYLKAAWLTPFVAAETAGATFTRADGSTVQVPTMHSLVRAPYAAGTGWAAIELPYVGNQLALLAIVPDDLAAFEASFDPARLDAIVGALETNQVNLFLPKFDIESRIELGDVLEALGMPTAFSGDADFSGITKAEALAISRVIHQANITVDEKGTEAAAATIVGMDTAGGAEPATLRVDRPFLFVLRDVPTGAVVFMGRVADPSVAR